MVPRSRMGPVAVLVLSLAGVLAAQPGGDPNAIRLRSRTFIPREGIDSTTLRHPRLARREPVHVLVQFRVPATPEIRNALSNQNGVRWLRPLTPRVWWAVTPADTPSLRTLAARVRWVGMPRPTDKIAPRSVWQTLPPTKPDSGIRAAIFVQFFRDLRVPEQRAVLQRYGAQRIGRVATLNAWEVTIAVDSILPLAAEDGVEWIENAQGPPSPNNDKVRSVSGINADAVLSPSLYALSGNGVEVAYWDNTLPSRHQDFSGRIAEAEALSKWMRNFTHVENTINGQLDAGETVYLDVDDSETVTADDRRLVGGVLLPPNPADLTKPLALFNPDEMFVDFGGDGLPDDTDPIYRDLVADGTVKNGDDLLIAGTAATDGRFLTPFPDDPHWHSTVVVGAMVGDGALSVARGATSANQWKSVASSAKLRSFINCDIPCSNLITGLETDMTAASAAGNTTFTHPWGVKGSTCILEPRCYTVLSASLDSYANGRDESGGAVALTRPGLSVVSAGNLGHPERHGENVTEDGLFQEGESIYEDRDGDGVVSAAKDKWLSGPVLDDGAELVDFRIDERHTFAIADAAYVAGQAVYLDVNKNGIVDLNDQRLTTVGALTPGPVQGGDADAVVASPLRRFKYWFTVNGGTSGKNTLQVGAISSDATSIPAFSARGPTTDGRLKPDLVAPGTASFSDGIKVPYIRNTYTFMSGTSMSAGVGAAAMALLTEWYKQTCMATGPFTATARALLIHGAEDVVLPEKGAHLGPDFATGFGKLRVKEAIDLVPHHVVTSIASTTAEVSIPITIGRTRGLKVTLAWSDVPTAPSAVETEHGLLQNDLDIKLIAPDNSVHMPWIADAADPFAGAKRSSFASGVTPTAEAHDRRNTVEQVLIDDAMAGTWQIVVNASQLNFGPQGFAVVSEAISPSASPCVATPATDVWLRDNNTDVGTVPSSGSLWLGPDLWNRVAEDGGTAHQNPEYGQTNYLYVNLRNRGAALAKATTVELWIADASTGLSWPANYSLVGRMSVPNLAAGSDRVVGPLAWTPPAPGLSGHFCMYMRVLNRQDPITITENASIGTNAQTSNNIAYRNLFIVDLASEKRVKFIARNTLRDTANVELMVRIPPAFLQVGEVRLTLSPALAAAVTDSLSAGSRGLVRESRSGPRSLTLDGPIGANTYRLTSAETILPAVRMSPGRVEQLTISFFSTQTSPATYDVDVVQRAQGQTVGGIRYVVRTGTSPPP